MPVRDLWDALEELRAGAEEVPEGGGGGDGDGPPPGGGPPGLPPPLPEQAADTGADRPYLSRGVWNILEWQGARGRFAEDPQSTAAPSPEWEDRVTEFLHLYVSVTDPNLTQWVDGLSFLEKCQAITVFAKDCDR